MVFCCFSTFHVQKYFENIQIFWKYSNLASKLISLTHFPKWIRCLTNFLSKLTKAEMSEQTQIIWARQGLCSFKDHLTFETPKTEEEKIYFCEPIKYATEFCPKFEFWSTIEGSGVFFYYVQKWLQLSFKSINILNFEPVEAQSSPQLCDP